MIYAFPVLAILIAGPLYGSSDGAKPPALERKPSLVEQVVAREQQLSEELRLDLLRKEASLKLEASFIEAAKGGKSLSNFLAMSLNFNAQDAEGKTALMHLVMRYAICPDTALQAVLFKDIEALMTKKARAFSIRDKLAWNAWDYAVGQPLLRELMENMQSEDRIRRASVDAVMNKLPDFYRQQEETKEK